MGQIKISRTIKEPRAHDTIIYPEKKKGPMNKKQMKARKRNQSESFVKYEHVARF